MLFVYGLWVVVAWIRQSNSAGSVEGNPVLAYNVIVRKIPYHKMGHPLDWSLPNL